MGASYYLYFIYNLKFNNMTEFIGKKITGIKFPTSKKVFFHGEMTQYIGRQGTIIDYNEELDSFKVAYADGKTFSYPVEKVFNELFF